MKQHDPASCVCHELDPVARVWQKIRDELNIYVLHHDRQRVFDIVARELAERLLEDAALREIEGEAELAQYGRELAKVISPGTKENSTT